MKLFACPLRRCCKETARPLGDEIHERVLIDPPSGCVAVWTYFSPRLPASGAQRAPASKASAPFQHGAFQDSHAPPAFAIFFILLTSLVDVFLRSFFTCAVACHISVRALPMHLLRGQLMHLLRGQLSLVRLRRLELKWLRIVLSSRSCS